AARVQKIASSYAEDNDHFVLIGIGGSSLGAETLLKGAAPAFGKKKFYLIDHLDSNRVQQVLEEIDPKRTCLCLVSKSGKTFESLATFLIFRKFLKEKLGIGYRRHLVVITDPAEGPLRKMIEEEKLESFAVPPGVGGRFSVLTPAGLFPAAFFGVNLQELLSGGRRMDEFCQREDWMESPAFVSAVIHYLFAVKKKKHMRVVLTYAEALHTYGDWFCQLWAESLGKKFSLNGKPIYAGSTPIPSEGVRDQHSQLQLYLEGPFDKVIDFVTVEKGNSIKIPEAPASLGESGRQLQKKELRDLAKAEEQATIDALTSEKRPNVSYRLPELNAHSLGQLLLLSEIETVVAGQLWGINPFDQPAVEIIKKNVRARIG
ncbi:MAG: glucose-6-phosphate isomerase, partial [bacterium]|nr:glucose-6-phosphate isomerase [bacterium]